MDCSGDINQGVSVHVSYAPEQDFSECCTSHVMVAV